MDNRVNTINVSHELISEGVGKMKTSIRKLLTCLIVFSLVTVILLGTNLPVNAQNEPTEEINIVKIAGEQYAKRFNVTLDEAIKRLYLQNEFPGLSTALEQNEKDTYGGLWIQHEPEYKICIAFTQNGELTIEKYKQYITQEVASYIEIKLVKKSQVELINQMQKLVKSLDKQGIECVARTDIINNCVSIDIKKADEEKYNAAKMNDQLVLPDELDVNFVDGLVVQNTEIYGGLTINAAGSYCTSGFGVRNYNGTIKGITTAGHAADTTFYYLGNSLPYQNGYFTGAYDCQWHTCPGLTVTNKIQIWSSGATLNITATKTRNEQHVGDIVMKYGAGTQYTSGQISCVNTALPPPCTSPTWIEVTNIYGYPVLSGGGDSGCPWYCIGASVTYALGVHSSGAEAGQKAYYMAQNYLTILGMVVMTSP